MATTSNTKSVTGSSATYDSGSFLKQTWSETTAAGANTFAINSDATSAKLSLRGSGDAIYVNGLSGEYQVKASGKTVTLKSDSQTITIVLNSVSKSTVVANTIYFVDGSLTLGNSSGSSTLKLGSQTLSSKLKVISAEVSESETAASYFDGTSAATSAVQLADGITPVVGTTENDTFNGDTFGSTATLEDGDNINGGAGTDTLNITANGTAATFTLTSVENVNVELWSAQTLDMARWSGTTSVNITNNSVADKTLTLTNASYGATYGVNGDSDLAVTFANDTGSGDTVKLALNSAGASGDNSAITFNGGNEALTITNSGVSYATVDASATSVTVTGNGNLTLDIANDVVSGLSYAGFSGTTNTTVTASTLAFTGGAGNDTLTITGLSSADSLQGGAGTDTLKASLDQADLTLVSGFEAGVFAVSASVDQSNSGMAALGQMATLTFSGGAAATDITLSGIAATTINLDNTTSDDVYLGISGTTLAVNLTSTAAVSYDDLLISGAETVNLVAADKASAVTVADLRLMGADTITVGVGSGASLNATGFSGREAESITVGVSGQGGSLTLGTLNVSGVTAFTVNAAGTGGAIDLGAIAVSGQALALTVNASGTTDVEIDALSAGAGANLTVDLNVDANVDFGSAGDFDIAIANSGSLALDVAVGASGNSKVSTVDVGVSGTVSVNYAVGASGLATQGAISGQAITSFNAAVAAEGSATFTTLDARTIGNIGIAQAGSGTVILGNISGTNSIGNITVSGGNDATVTIADLVASGSIGNLTVSLGHSGTFAFGSAEIEGGASAVGSGGTGSFGNITLAAGNVANIDLGAISAQADIGNVSVQVGTSGAVTILGLNAYSAAVGTINISAGTSTIVSAESIAAETTIGAITLNGSGTIELDSLQVSASIGNITVGDGTRATISGTTLVVGDISLAGDAAVVTFSAKTVGDIDITGSAATITLSNSAAIGDVTVHGVGNVSLDFVNATGIASISTVGHSGTTTIDVDSIRASSVEITLGTGTNVVLVNTAGTIESDDVGVSLTLAAGTGADTIKFAGSAYNGVAVQNFQFGSGGDALSFYTAGFSLGFGSAVTEESAGNLDVINVYTAGVTFTPGVGASADATEVIVLTTGTFDTFADVLTALGNGGSLQLAVAPSAVTTATQELFVVWYNNSEHRTELTVVGGSAANNTADADMWAALGSYETLASFSGDIRSFGSAETFAGNFKAY